MKLQPTEPMITPRLRVIARLRDAQPPPEHYGPCELAMDTLGAVVLTVLAIGIIILSGSAELGKHGTDGKNGNGTEVAR